MCRAGLASGKVKKNGIPCTLGRDITAYAQKLYRIVVGESVRPRSAEVRFFNDSWFYNKRGIQTRLSENVRNILINPTEF